MYLACGKTFSVEEVTEKLIEELLKPRSIEDYRAYLGFIGQSVGLILGDERVPATLLSVDNEGRLVVDINGEERVFSSAEVSIWL
jgi:biotin-(acetyl-CoA carboxylase) ligase